MPPQDNPQDQNTNVNPQPSFGNDQPAAAPTMGDGSAPAEPVMPPAPSEPAEPESTDGDSQTGQPFVSQ